MVQAMLLIRAMFFDVRDSFGGARLLTVQNKLPIQDPFLAPAHKGLACKTKASVTLLCYSKRALCALQ